MALASQNLPFTLTLTTEQRPGRFTLTWDTGSYSLEFRPETDVTLGDLLRRLQPVLAGGRDSSEKLAPAELLQVVGTQLWQALFPATAPVDKREALAHELRTGTTPLHLALPPKLAVLPWELLCDPQAPDETGFLARRRPLARLIPSGSVLPPLVPPLRILLLISSPPRLDEQQPLDVESELAAVESATLHAREAGLLHLHVEDVVTPRRVQQSLLRFKPHIVHYIGHGSYDEDNGGYLVWEDEHGDPLYMFDTHLADLLRPRRLRAVLLHGCQTASSDVNTDLRSVASALLNADVPAVLAQQASFTYESSQQGSEMFYTALTNGAGLAEATFEMRLALAQADRPDWAVPTLQATTGGLFPLLKENAPFGRPDPTLIRRGAAADLPAPTGVFVGRQPELRDLRTMLESPPGSGPVFALITGPGGIGKSTLAAQAITRYGGRYKATLTLRCLSYQGMDLFLKQIGEFLLRREASRFLEQTLPEATLSQEAKIQVATEELNRVGPCIIIIDNLESAQREDRTAIDPSMLLLLQKLLTNLRGGRVMGTGRYVVEGLLPEGKFAAHMLRLDLGDLSRREILQLLERYQSLARLGNTVREELVEAFGGLPYIYDLLNSRAASENLTELIHDAQGRITHEHQQQTAAEWQQVRQQVIEFATLDMIVKQLPEKTRMLLAHLSIFRRPFPLESVEQGLEASHTDWQSLMDWGLLRRDPLGSQYSLHSLTSRYAAELVTKSERINTQIRVAKWYVNYAESSSHDLSDYLEAHDLFRAAEEVHQAGELAMRLAAVLRQFGLYRILQDLCRAILQDTHNNQNRLTAQALHELGIIAQQQGRYEEARRCYNESLTIKNFLDDQHGRASSLYQLGMIAQEQGEYRQARSFYKDALNTFEQLNDQEGQAVVFGQLGIIAEQEGNYKAAQKFYKKNLAIVSGLVDQDGMAETLLNLGNIAYLQEKYNQAYNFYKRAYASFERLHDRSGLAKTLHQMGKIAHEQGDDTTARRLSEKALTFFEQLGEQSGRATILHQLGMIAHEQGDIAAAQRLSEEALLLFDQLNDQSGRAHTLLQLGIVAQEEGKDTEAQNLYREALTIFERLNEREGQASTLGQFGLLAYQQGNYDEALNNLAQSLVILKRLHSPLYDFALATLAEIRTELGEALFASLWQKATHDQPLPTLPVNEQQ
jgi:tetratricopeptide (TPR) repeat protein